MSAVAAFYAAMMTVTGVWLLLNVRPRLPGEWIAFVAVVTFWPLFLLWIATPASRSR